MPARASYRDLLRDLLGCTVAVRGGADQQLGPERLAYLAAYRFDDGQPAAIVVTDLRLATVLAASIASLSAAEAHGRVEETGRLDAELLDNFHEVANVGAKLLNSPMTPHVVLRELVEVPGKVAGDLAGIASSPGRRQDWQVTVDGYGDGAVTLLG